MSAPAVELMDERTGATRSGSLAGQAPRCVAVALPGGAWRYYFRSDGRGAGTAASSAVPAAEYSSHAAHGPVSVGHWADAARS